MDDRTRALIELSAALARGSRGEWRERMARAIAVAAPTEVEEALLQSYLFLGYPVLLQALAVWREVQPESTSVEGPGSLDQWKERGQRTFAVVYSDQHDKLLEHMEAVHPDVARWMLTEGYGKVLSRPALDLKTRELCIIALLAAQDAEKQLHSHLRGAMNAGAIIADIDEAMAISCTALPRERAQQARTLWKELRARLTVREST